LKKKKLNQRVKILVYNNLDETLSLYLYLKVISLQKTSDFYFPKSDKRFILKEC